MDDIYWVNCRYKFIIYSPLDQNKISDFDYEASFELFEH
jgi:hypothetical protein